MLHLAGALLADGHHYQGMRLVNTSAVSIVRAPNGRNATVNADFNGDDRDAELASFYRRALTALNSAEIPFLVGGAYALHPFTGVARDTKDFDIFVRPSDQPRTLETLEQAGYRTEVSFPHWLSKAYCGVHFIDIIHSSGNGIAEVDDEWFTYAVEAQLLGMPIRLCPPEETIWSKAFIMERERYDGADVAHLLHASAHKLDWHRLLRRFDQHWRVLFSHLILFGYIYPSERGEVPDWVLFHLIRRLLTEVETEPEAALVCRGTFLSRAQYLPDIQDWGYQDARVAEGGTMSSEDAETWSEASPQEPADH
jgi:hypothetical protein